MPSATVTLTNSNKRSARLFWDDSYPELGAGLPAMNSGNDWRAENGILTETHIFTPNLVNAATLTIARNTFIRAPFAQFALSRGGSFPYVSKTLAITDFKEVKYAR